MLRQRRAAISISEYDKQTRQGWVCAVVCLLLMGGFMVYALRDARIRIGNQDALDKSGVTTMGRIDGTSMRGGKSTTYLIQYTFELNGTPYHHSSPVTSQDYNVAQPGQSVRITYLPDRPEISRAQQSIARREAEGMQVAAYLGLVVVAIFPLVYSFSRRSQRRRISR